MEDLLVSVGVVEGDERHIDTSAGGGLDELERVVDDGERGQAEEVHLEQAHLFDGLHVVSSDYGVVFGAGDWNKFGEGPGGDDDACRANAASADEAFEAECGVDELLDLGVGLVGAREGG